MGILSKSVPWIERERRGAVASREADPVVVLLLDRPTKHVSVELPAPLKVSDTERDHRYVWVHLSPLSDVYGLPAARTDVIKRAASVGGKLEVPDDRGRFAAPGGVSGGGGQRVQRPDVRRIPWGVGWRSYAVVEIGPVVAEERGRCPWLLAPANLKAERESGREIVAREAAQD